MNTNTGLRQPRYRKPLGSFVAVATVSAAAAMTMALAGAPAGALANEAAAPAVAARLAELERQFWLCDHAATRTLLDFTTAARCSAAYEELRQQRFGGDFNAMLAWWRERKGSEHAALDAAAAPAAAARTAPARGSTPSAPAKRPPAPPAGPLDAATPEQLKAAYLHCDRLATTEHFDSAVAAMCSMVYEALKARVFGGSFERLVAWRQKQQAALAGGGTAARQP